MEKERMKRQLDRLAELSRGSRRRRLWFAPRRYIYGQFFQKLAYPLLRRGRLVTARTFWGDEMQVLLPAAMDVFLLGGKTHDSELRLTRFMIDRLSSGDQVADIGAHFGFFSLLAARLVGPHGQVEAFEPAGATFEVLERNLQNFSNANARHQAVSDSEGLLAFYEFHTLYTEYNTLIPGQFAGRRWFRRHPPLIRMVSAVTLDDFCRRRDFYPGFIKIDVEGAEDKVIGGMQELLSSTRPVIVLEYLAGARNNQAHRQAARRLEEWGYFPHLINEDGGLEPCVDIERSLAERGLDSDNLVFCAEGRE